jgi:hypothetical protein
MIIIMNKIKLLPHKIHKIINELTSTSDKHTSRNKFYGIGFHGDTYLIEFIKSLIHRCSFFVETGTNVGTTLAYTAKLNPSIQCFSCEPDEEAFSNAVINTKGLNVELFNETSQDFMKRIAAHYASLFSADGLFWLDAHGYGFMWPLREEIEFITNNFSKAYIFIDDFKVPGMSCFGYDRYEDQECSYEYIKDSMLQAHNYTMYYPNYKDKTSEHHPLRGWCLIEYGHDDAVDIPDCLKERIRRIQ